MVNLTPAGREKNQIDVPGLMEAPAGKVKKVGDRAVVRRSSGELEADWIIGNFNPESGAVTVSKTDARGRIITKEIPRDEYFKMNFPQSEEIFYALEDERRKIFNKVIFGESSREAIMKEQEEFMEVKNAFEKGELEIVRNHFFIKLKELEKRYEGEDKLQREIRQQALQDIEKFEKEMADMERNRLGSRGKERESGDLALIRVKEDLKGAKIRFEDANRRLSAGHSDLSKLKEFVIVLDREMEKGGKRAAA